VTTATTRAVELPAVRTLLLFAAPVAGGLLAQTLMGLVSTAMVGRLGPSALAGVGVAGALFSVLLAVLYGPVAAIQALTARAFGAGRAEEAGRPLTVGLVLSLILALALCALAMTGVATLLPRVLPSEAALQGQRYLAGFAPILIALAANMSFTAYWNGAGVPRRAFYVSALQLPLHALLSYALVFGHFGAPALGVFGAGLAASLSAGGATLAHLTLALKLTPIDDFFRRVAGPGLGAIMRIGLPISLQQALLYVGLAIYFTIIARLGIAAAAALNVINSLLVIPSLIASGLGAAAATHVGAAMGAGSPDAAERTGWRTARLAALVLTPFSLGLALAPNAALRVFIADPATIAFAAPPLRILALSIVLDGATQALVSSLTGAGATRLAAATAFILQWALQLPLVWWVGTRLGYGLTGVAVVFVVRSLLEVGVMAMLWRWGWWKRALVGGSDIPPPAPALAPRRIMVLGGAGAGKSTLARTLGAHFGLPVIHLDRLRYDPGWTLVDPALFSDRLADVAATEAWVVDGTYGESRARLMPRAELILWLDQPAPLRLYRTWRKTAHPERPRADRPDGCEEAFGWRYVRTILSFGRWTPRVDARLHAAAPEADIRCLRGDRGRARFLTELGVAESSREPASSRTARASPPSPAASGASRR